MFGKLIYKTAASTAGAAAVIAFGVGLSVPVSSGIAAAQGSCVGFDVAAAGPLDAPQSSASCEEYRDSCLAMHRQEDVYGNGYIPADDYHDCMQGYWDCKGQG